MSDPPAGGPTGGAGLPFALSGVIEGFYGPPWSWEVRAEVMAWCHQRGMGVYLYAPKDDPRHRERWREPYGPEELAGFDALVAADTLAVGFAISPGLSMDYAADDDRAALAAKVDQLVERGVSLVALLLDDIPVRPGLGPDHAELTTWLFEHLDGRADLVLTPTEYTGTRPTPYLEALAAGTPAEVLIGWTGTTVVCDEITLAQAEARAASVGDRPPLVWDNYPVNDGLMSDRLFMGPLRGRDPRLAAVCAGYVANPMVQGRASRTPLASVAAYTRGADPEAGWQADLGPLRVFAEACDGEHPRALVAAVLAGDPSPEPLAVLERWLAAAKDAAAPGLDDEVGPWLDQVHREARVGLAAVNLLRALADPDPGAGPTGEAAVGLAMAWLPLRRAPVSVMGTRGSLRPVMGQSSSGAWTYRAAAVTEGANAIDDLVRHALALAAEPARHDHRFGRSLLPRRDDAEPRSAVLRARGRRGRTRGCAPGAPRAWPQPAGRRRAGPR